MTESIVTKTCKKCNITKPVSEYTGRSGYPLPTSSYQCLSQCKACMKVASANHIPLPPQEARAYSDQLALAYLADYGIPALPGKAYRMANLDVLAWGCVRIEVKYSSINTKSQGFHFGLTRRQQRDGYLADVVLLICDYPDGRKTFHCFDPSNPAFYFKSGKRKMGYTFTPGQERQLKFTATRVCLTQPIMDMAQDRVDMIEDCRVRMSNELRTSAALKRMELVVNVEPKAA